MEAGLGEFLGVPRGPVGTLTLCPCSPGHHQGSLPEGEVQPPQGVHRPGLPAGHVHQPQETGAQVKGGGFWDGLGWGLAQRVRAQLIRQVL